VRTQLQKQRIAARSKIAIRETVTVRLPFTGDTQSLAHFPVWQSRVLDVKGATLVQGYLSFTIVDDNEIVAVPSNLEMGARISGSWSSGDVALSPIVRVRSGNAPWAARGPHAFPVMTASDSLATEFRFQFLATPTNTDAGARRVLTLRLDGMLVAGVRSRRRQ